MSRVCLVSFLLLLFTISFSHGQRYAVEGHESRWKVLDQQSKIVPETLTTPSAITDHLVADLTDEKDKIRAIYVWITHNIVYDRERFKAKRTLNFASDDEFIRHALANRKAVCAGFSKLFHEMASHAGIEVYTISGYARSDREATGLGSHAWNGIHLKTGEWLLLDVTWDTTDGDTRRAVQKGEIFKRINSKILS